VAGLKSFNSGSIKNLNTFKVILQYDKILNISKYVAYMENIQLAVHISRHNRRSIEDKDRKLYVSSSSSSLY
jgi:hypothetical protein